MIEKCTVCKKESEVELYWKGLPLCHKCWMVNDEMYYKETTEILENALKLKASKDAREIVKEENTYEKKQRKPRSDKGKRRIK